MNRDFKTFDIRQSLSDSEEKPSGLSDSEEKLSGTQTLKRRDLNHRVVE
jgi:hypothetical protein